MNAITPATRLSTLVLGALLSAPASAALYCDSTLDPSWFDCETTYANRSSYTWIGQNAVNVYPNVSWPWYAQAQCAGAGPNKTYNVSVWISGPEALFRQGPLFLGCVSV